MKRPLFEQLVVGGVDVLLVAVAWPLWSIAWGGLPAAENVIREGSVSLILFLLDLYSFVLFVSVALSWLRLSPDNPVVRVTSALTEPLLAPLRRVIPPVGGFDLTPMVLLLLIQLVKRLLFSV